MNNNRNNNRRRGRGNNNRNQNGGGNQMNRIDSRARGNAPQLLDKYKKLAQDAQHHGDRVQAEYYLQFADHYQRVIADNKALQDEARAKRNEGREAGGEEGRDGEDGRQDSRNRRPRNRNDRNDNRGENRGDNRRDEGRAADQQEGEIGSEGDAIEVSSDAGEGEAAEKPAKPRRARSERAPRVKKDEGAEAKPRAAKTTRTPRKKPAKADDGIDVGVLPPAISADGDADNAEAAE
ncbi:MAG: DUF4167 domain-containing protein [Marinomonas sp.]